MYTVENGNDLCKGLLEASSGVMVSVAESCGMDARVTSRVDSSHAGLLSLPRAQHGSVSERLAEVCCLSPSPRPDRCVSRPAACERPAGGTASRSARSWGGVRWRGGYGHALGEHTSGRAAGEDEGDGRGQWKAASKNRSWMAPSATSVRAPSECHGCRRTGRCEPRLYLFHAAG
jgi:hypothetical protein